MSVNRAHTTPPYQQALRNDRTVLGKKYVGVVDRCEVEEARKVGVVWDRCDDEDRSIDRSEGKRARRAR